VVKIPRFTFEKFPQADPVLTTQMKSVGEAMAIGRTFKEAMQKALRSLETLAEILEGTRLVHCHSYRQDEILMLIRLADRLGFRIGTFQHVLEGYKVAPEIAAHGAGASSFSDWWAYKIEVMDAIPWNGAMLEKAGVLVSFNSDSDELARRMNMEAAKAVRYGNLAPEEALKFVTLNPAKQLGIDARTGSLEPALRSRVGQCVPGDRLDK